MVGDMVGWIGVALGLFVAPPQLIKILRHKNTDGISLMTYIFLCMALVCYLLHAIHIHDAVFITAQSVNLTTNTAILLKLLSKCKTSVK